MASSNRRGGAEIIPIIQQTGDPAAVAGFTQFYGKAVAGATVAFMIAGGGVVSQVTGQAAAFTVASVPFADSSGRLAADVANFAWDNTGKSVTQGGGSGATVSAANKGKLIYNEVAQAWQISSNGGAFASIVSGTGTGMAIGNTIGNSPTVGSVLFVGAAGVLAQNNANFFWDNTNSFLALAGGVADYGFKLTGGQAFSLARWRNTNIAGITGMDVFDSTNAQTAAFGYGNASFGTTHLRNVNFWLSANSKNMVICDGTKNAFFFDMTNYRMQISGVGITPAAPTETLNVHHNTNDGTSGGIRVQNINTTNGRISGMSAFDSTLVRGFFGCIQNGAGSSVGYARNTGATPGVMASTTPSDICWIFQSQDTTGFGGCGFAGGTTLPAGVIGSIGVGNSAAPITDFRATPFLFCGSGADWIIGNAAGALIRFGTVTNSVFEQMANGSSAAVSAASTGRLRYNTTGQKSQMSFNGAAYFDVATYAAALTSGSVPFANGSNQLAQDNATFFWDTTNKRLGLGTTTPGTVLVAFGSNSANNIIDVKNTNTAGYSATGWQNSAGTQQGSVGFANSTVGITHIQSLIYMYSEAADIAFAQVNANQHRFGMTNGSAYYELQNGEAGPAGVSRAGTVRFKYNDTAKTLMLSFDGAAYVTVQTA